MRTDAAAKAAAPQVQAQVASISNALEADAFLMKQEAELLARKL